MIKEQGELLHADLDDVSLAAQYRRIARHRGDSRRRKTHDHAVENIDLRIRQLATERLDIRQSDAGLFLEHPRPRTVGVPGLHDRLTHVLAGVQRRRVLALDDHRLALEEHVADAQSQDAMQIVDTLLTLMKRNGARIKTEHKVVAIRKTGEGFSLSFADNGKPQVEADIVVVTIGGCPRDADLGLIEGLDIETVSPMPSLFSLRISDNSLTALMGTVVENTSASLCGTKFKSAGPLLITHWGVSGPAILKLSSYAARHLGECGYKAHLAVNWLGCDNEEKTRELIAALGAQNRLKRVGNIYPTQLNARLWAHLLGRAGIETDTRWVDLSKKSVNKLVSTLISDTYAVDGKNRFKDEFVTSGGVALVGIDHKTLECRGCRNMYFAGEVLDVDAVTGGFNLQAAWTMGFVVAKSIAQKQHTNI